jgi:hypothetical protein
MMFAITRMFNAAQRAWNWAESVLASFALDMVAVVLWFTVMTIGAVPMAVLAGLVTALAGLMFATHRLFIATERVWDEADSVMEFFSLARAAVTLWIMVVAICIGPMAVFAAVTTFLAFGYLFLRITLLCMEVIALSVFELFFARFRYRRLGTADDRRPPPTYDEWCASVDANIGNVSPRVLALEGYTRLFPQNFEWGSSSASDASLSDYDISLRQRQSTSAASTPRLLSRLNRPSSRETIEGRDYGFEVSPEGSVIDGVGLDGPRVELDPLTAYYSRVSERNSRGRSRGRDTA